MCITTCGNNDFVDILRHVGGRGGCWLCIVHKHVVPRSVLTEISSVYPRHVLEKGEICKFSVV